MSKPMPRRIASSILLLCLAACESVPTSPPRAALTAPAATDTARKAEIRRQIASACPQPLSPAALRRAADHLDRHPDAAEVIADLDRLDEGARVCRGLGR